MGSDFIGNARQKSLWVKAAVNGIQYVAVAAGGNFQMDSRTVTRPRYSDCLSSYEAVLLSSRINDAYALLYRPLGLIELPGGTPELSYLLAK